MTEQADEFCPHGIPAGVGCSVCEEPPPIFDGPLGDMTIAERTTWLLDDARADALMTGVPRYEPRYTHREQEIVNLLQFAHSALACMGECFGPKNTNETWAEMVADLRREVAAVALEQVGWWVNERHPHPERHGSTVHGEFRFTEECADCDLPAEPVYRRAAPQQGDTRP